MPCSHKSQTSFKKSVKVKKTKNQGPRGELITTAELDYYGFDIPRPSTKYNGKTSSKNRVIENRLTKTTARTMTQSCKKGLESFRKISGNQEKLKIENEYLLQAHRRNKRKIKLLKEEMDSLKDRLSHCETMIYESMNKDFKQQTTNSRFTDKVSIKEPLKIKTEQQMNPERIETQPSPLEQMLLDHLPLSQNLTKGYSQTERHPYTEPSMIPLEAPQNNDSSISKYLCRGESSQRNTPYQLEELSQQFNLLVAQEEKANEFQKAEIRRQLLEISEQIKWLSNRNK